MSHIPHLERRSGKTMLACCGLMFASGREEQPNRDILSLEEGEMRGGLWETVRRLSGDEAAFMKYDAPSCSI